MESKNDLTRSIHELWEGLWEGEGEDRKTNPYNSPNGGKYFRTEKFVALSSYQITKFNWFRPIGA